MSDTIHYLIFTRVVTTDERTVPDGGALIRGWFVHFEGSRESVYLGAEKPHLKVGDRVCIRIERVEDEEPSPEPSPPTPTEEALAK